MTNQTFFRSCEVVMFHKKLTTSLIANNNLIKSLPCYRGRHISNNITLLSKVFQRCYKLFKLFIYKVFPLTTSQKVFEPRQRGRKIMLTGRQDYTNPDRRRVQTGPFQRAALAPMPGVFAMMNSSHCNLLGPRTILIVQRFPKIAQQE